MPEKYGIILLFYAYILIHTHPRKNSNPPQANAVFRDQESSPNLLFGTGGKKPATRNHLSRLKAPDKPVQAALQNQSILFTSRLSRALQASASMFQTE